MYQSTGSMALFVEAMPEKNIVNVVAEIFVEQLFDSELLPPMRSVVDHGGGVLHAGIFCSQEFEKDNIAPVVLEKWNTRACRTPRDHLDMKTMM